MNSAIAYGDPYSKHSSMDKLYINSDSLVIDQTKQQAFFSGEVILWFDDMMVKTTNLEIFYKIVDNKKTINYIFIPSRLTAKRNDGQELLIATSAKYFVERKELVLLGNVIVQNKDGIVRTDKLVYYTKLNNVD
ncbi:MAG: LptA/OstA family protein [Rickettsia endosymbiont of Pseudomimeciton antennatum]|nr:LptA/OstA family protein [Rickettsia endosymbiont of Pseudomimeciton antennatum]MCC8397743.1 LptA/OstA family protein [Rickettsia endosymbiont of Labidopullus appendiculatus]